MKGQTEGLLAEQPEFVQNAAGSAIEAGTDRAVNAGMNAGANAVRQQMVEVDAAASVLGADEKLKMNY